MTEPGAVHLLDVLDQIEAAHEQHRERQVYLLAAAGWTPDPARGLFARLWAWLRRKT